MITVTLQHLPGKCYTLSMPEGSTLGDAIMKTDIASSDYALTNPAWFKVGSSEEKVSHNYLLNQNDRIVIVGKVR